MRVSIEVLIKFAAELVVAGIVAATSAVWLTFGKNLSVPVGAIVFASTAIVAAYGAIVAVHHFSPATVSISRHGKMHFMFFAAAASMLLSPFPVIVNNARSKQMTTRAANLEKEVANLRSIQTDLDRKRIQIYAQITDSLQTSLHKTEIDAADLNDLLHFCLESILLSKPNTHDLRAAVFYLDKTKRYLVVPPNGYYGYALDQDIRGLYFDVSPRLGSESDETYLERLGVAGSCFVNRMPIKAGDVRLPNTLYRYKPFAASQRDQPDRAMICIGIPNLDPQKSGEYIGVLAVSSLTRDVFTDNDFAITRFFAALLGRFKTSPEAPPLTATAAHDASKLN